MTLVNAPTIRHRAWAAPRIYITERPKDAPTIPLPLRLADRFSIGLVSTADTLAELIAIPGFAQNLTEALNEPDDPGA